MARLLNGLSDMSKRWSRICGLAALVGLVPALGTAAYRLQPGDTVQMSISGLPESVIESTIDIDGNLSLAWFGEVPAAGRDLAAVLTQLRSKSVGQVIKRYNNEGDLKLVNVNPEDVFLKITGYQPIVVGGDVSEAGSYDFRPGLTVRAAIALAGGEADLLIGDDLQDQIQLLRWQSDFSEAALAHAAANMQYWRITAEIDADFDAAPPAAEGMRVSKVVYDELLAEQQRLMATGQTEDEGQRAFLAKALVQAKARQEILTQQKGKQSEAIAADEAEEARVKELLAGGLTNASRVSDARRAVVLTATRLLEIEENLARAELDVTRMARDLDAYEEQRMSRLLEARDTTRNAIYTAKLRMDSLARLQSTSEAVMLDEITGEPVAPVVLIYRRTDGVIESIEAQMDDMVQPGDTINVNLGADDDSLIVPQTQ